MSLQYVRVVLILSLFQHDVDALSSRADPATEDACPVKRSLYKIVWSCVLTTIICAWVSVHPNVPPSGYWKGLSRRVKMMIWTIIAPELILAWAVRQWFAAWEIRDTVNGSEEGWLAGIKQTIQGWFKRGTEGERCRLIACVWTEIVTSVEQMDYGAWPPPCDGGDLHRRPIS